MDIIFYTKKGVMEFLNSSAFHSLEFGSIMAKTVESLRAFNLQGWKLTRNPIIMKQANLFAITNSP